jgi:hypothetical protein
MQRETRLPHLQPGSPKLHGQAVLHSAEDFPLVANEAGLQTGLYSIFKCILHPPDLYFLMFFREVYQSVFYR